MLWWKAVVSLLAFPIGIAFSVNASWAQDKVSLAEIKEFNPREAVEKVVIDREKVGLVVSFMEPGQGIPSHDHPSDHIHILIEGKVTMTVDGKKRALKAGDIQLVPKGAKAEIKNDGGTRAVSLIVITKEGKAAHGKGMH